MISANLLPLHTSNVTSVNPLWESIVCNYNRKIEREGGGGGTNHYLQNQLQGYIVGHREYSPYSLIINGV